MNPSLWSLPQALFQELRLWLVPIGSGMDWWGPEGTIPRGFVASYGQVYETAKYPRLAKAWGITAATITMPDKRGRMSIGKDDMGGTAANRVTSGGSGIAGNTLYASGGAETVSLASANNGSHAHVEVGRVAGSVDSGQQNVSVVQFTNGGGDVATSSSTQSSGSGTAHQNMPPGIVCNYIIRVG